MISNSLTRTLWEYVIVPWNVRRRRQITPAARSLQAGIERAEERLLLSAQYQFEQSGSQYFGSTLAASEQYYAVGNYAAGSTDFFHFLDGQVSVYDAGTHALVRQFNGPVQGSEAFGSVIALSGNTLVVAIDNNQQIPANRRVSVFNVETGVETWTFSYGAKTEMERSLAIAISGNTLAVGVQAFTDQLGNVVDVAHVDIYNLTTGQLVRTIVDPANPGLNFYTQGFGFSVSLSGTTLAVGAPAFNGTAPEVVYLFDVTSGQKLRELTSSFSGIGGANTGFGTNVSISGNRVAIDSTYADTFGTTNGRGAVEVFDVITGEQKAAVHGQGPLDPFASNTGGVSPISLYNNRLAVLGAQRTNGVDQGRVYIYDATNGDLLQTLSNINLPNQLGSPYLGGGSHLGYFGGSVSLSGARLLTSGSINSGYFSEGANSKAYVFSTRGDDLLIFDAATGRWRLGTNNGGSFVWTNGPKWSAAAGWRTVIGDFDGNGTVDGLGINNQNAVFFAKNNGNGTMTTVSAGGFSSAETFQHLLVGDFDVDGRDDLLLQQATHNTTPLPGSWFLKSFNGNGFTTSFYGRWEAAGWVGFGVDDVNLDGAADIVGMINATGSERVNWMYGISNLIPNGSRRFASQFAGAFSGRVETAGWRDLQFGDWNGDLRLDVAARRADGRFVYGVSTGGPTDNAVLSANRLVNATGPLFSPTLFTNPFYVGDFNNDGRDDILGRQDNNKNLWVAVTTLAGLPPASATLWTAWNASTNWLGAAIGDFDGDYYDDYMSVDRINGQDWGTFTTGGFSPSQTQQQILGTELLVGPLTIRKGRSII